MSIGNKVYIKVEPICTVVCGESNTKISYLSRMKGHPSTRYPHLDGKEQNPHFAPSSPHRRVSPWERRSSSARTHGINGQKVVAAETQLPRSERHTPLPFTSAEQKEQSSGGSGVTAAPK